MKSYAAITMGDPAGIGPEICIKAMLHPSLFDACNPIIVGDKYQLQKTINQLSLPVTIHEIESIADGKYSVGNLNLIDVRHPDTEKLIIGEVSSLGAQMARSYILKAIEMGNEGTVQVVTTGPINKESFKLAQFDETNHTDMFKKFSTPVFKPISLFTCENLRVFHYTRHVSLLKAIESLDSIKISQKLAEIETVLKGIGYSNPRIALAALNPHASDNGMFGTEEANILVPAINLAKEAGINVDGPVPADVVFHQALNGKYDAVLSLFHDQGHIACKTYNFEKSVSTTLGYKFMRTTVDHGTAYDISGKGIASESNLLEAVIVAANYAANREENEA